MQARMDYFAKAPGILKGVLAFNKAVVDSGFDRKLLHLIKIRASQINGCSYCVDMHNKEARADGETEQRLYLIAAWRESPLYTERERLAFEWTEAVTLLSHGGVSDDLYARAKKLFSDEELVQMNAAVAVINVWNRFAVPFQSQHPVDAVADGKARAA